MDGLMLRNQICEGGERQEAGNLLGDRITSANTEENLKRRELVRE